MSAYCCGSKLRVSIPALMTSIYGETDLTAQYGPQKLRICPSSYQWSFCAFIEQEAGIERIESDTDRSDVA